MKERRSLNSALSSTPDLKSAAVRAFITGGAPMQTVTNPPFAAVPERLADPAVAPPTIADEPSANEVRETRPKRSAKPQSASQPFHSKIMISVTTRFEQRTADALRRAHLEQKLRHVHPGTQQEIIELAVQAWLREHDYLD